MVHDSMHQQRQKDFGCSVVLYDVCLFREKNFGLWSLKLFSTQLSFSCQQLDLIRERGQVNFMRLFNQIA